MGDNVRARGRQIVVGYRIDCHPRSRWVGSTSQRWHGSSSFSAKIAIWGVKCSISRHPKSPKHDIGDWMYCKYIYIQYIYIYKYIYIYMDGRFPILSDLILRFFHWESHMASLWIQPAKDCKSLTLASFWASSGHWPLAAVFWSPGEPCNITGKFGDTLW